MPSSFIQKCASKLDSRNLIFKINFKLVILCMFLLCLHILAIDLSMLSIPLAFIEFSILLFFTISQRVHSFLITALLFFSTNFEVAYFVTGESSGEIYSLLNLPLLKSYPIIILIFAQIFLILKKDLELLWLRKRMANFPSLRLLLGFAIFMQFIGLIVGAITVFSSESSLREWLFVYWVREVFSIGVFNSLLICFIYSICSYEKFSTTIRELLLALLVAMVFSSFHFVLSGKMGSYGTSDVLLMPLSTFFNCLILIFPLYQSYRNKLTLSLCAILVVILQISISHPLGGILWLLFISMPVILGVILMQQRRLFLLVAFLIAFFSMFSLMAINFDEVLSSEHSKNKLTQALMLSSFFSGKIDFVEWYEILPLSPKIRIEEFLNTILELMYNPQFALFGKGFGGAIQDHRGSFGMFLEGAFKDDQYRNGCFISLHVAISIFILKYGIIGFLFFISVVCKSLKNWGKTPWLVVGSVWLMIMYGYSNSIAVFGIASLVLGFFEVDRFR